MSRLPLETCQTIGSSWGYNINDDRFKSTEELLHLLIRTSGKGANLLLNVGPMPDGSISPECVERLDGIGRWMNSYGHTIYGTQAGAPEQTAWGTVTRKGNRYYIHILDPTVTEVKVRIPGIRSARWLNVEGAPKWTRDRRSDEVRFSFAGGKLDDTDSIIEVTVR